MSIAINPIIQTYYTRQVNPINSKKSAFLSSKNINFTSQIATNSAVINAPLNMRQSMITNSKTRLGANYNKETNSIDFKLASKNAHEVILCIFDKPKGENAKLNIKMNKKEGSNIWETSIPISILGGKEKPVYYAYRIFGPNWEFDENFSHDSTAGYKTLTDKKGNRFNPNKLAFDPYSKEISHLPSDNPKGEEAFIISKENCFEDNAKYAPKSVFTVSNETIIPKTSNRSLSDEIIGEVHIKDLSINEDTEVAGTYLGAKHMAKKLKDLGFTMIEFLPLTEFDDKEAGGNYWGYMPIGYFAPAKKYAYDKTPGAALKEFREMIKAFHMEDIKVCMDVVYNHTGEAAIVENDINKAKQESFSLIDNQMYYKQKGGIYNSNSGCGNDINVAQEEVMNFIADSIAFWAKQGVDAFRFDLAAGLMDIDKSEKVYYDASKSLVGKLSTMLKERGVNVLEPNQKGEGIYLIAEPWTCSGENSYQLGRFPDEWAQWNDIARETIKKDSTFPFTLTPRALKNVLEGSYDVLGAGNKSVNYIYSHDGFNLFDGNTYKSAPDCWHFATDYDGNKKRQENAMKKQIALTLLSKGTPMLQVGDVIGHSKGADDNSYNKDDKTNHLDFSVINNQSTIEYRLCDFTKKMIEFRKKHIELRDGTYNKNIQYYKPDGSFAQPWDKNYWDNVNSNIICYKIKDGGHLFFSSSSDEHFINIILPKTKEGKNWYLVCDTAREQSFVEQDEKIDYNYVQHPHSLLIFEER